MLHENQRTIADTSMVKKHFLWPFIIFPSILLHEVAHENSEIGEQYQYVVI